MSDRGWDQVTDRQKACLRLVFTGHVSKEIGRELGISEHTVDAHLKRVTRLLGVSTRFQAARLLIAREGFSGDAPMEPADPVPDAYQPLVHQPADLTDPPFSAIPPSSLDGQATTWGAGSAAVREDRQAFLLDAPRPATVLHLPFGGKGRPQNDLTVWGRIGWIFIIIIGLMVGTGLLLAGLGTLTQVGLAISAWANK